MSFKLLSFVSEYPLKLPGMLGEILIQQEVQGSSSTDVASKRPIKLKFVRIEFI